MVKIQLASDVHHECYDGPVLKEEDAIGEILLFAGDMTSGLTSMDYIAGWGKPCFGVLGNHEFYGRHWEGAIADYRERYKDSYLTLLENDTIFYKNVRIIGCTLWTNFLAPVPKGVRPFFGGDHDMEHQGFFCKQLMADFYEIKGITISGWAERHQYSLDYIKLMLSKKHDGPTIVMTHHAPSFRSSHPKWENSPIKGGFCSSLEYVIEEYQPDLWVHGHCHDSSDYRIGNTRVLCNPRGYGRENESGFQRQLVVEL